MSKRCSETNITVHPNTCNLPDLIAERHKKQYGCRFWQSHSGGTERGSAWRVDQFSAVCATCASIGLDLYKIIPLIHIVAILETEARVFIDKCSVHYYLHG